MHSHTQNHIWYYELYSSLPIQAPMLFMKQIAIVITLRVIVRGLFVMGNQ